MTTWYVDYEGGTDANASAGAGDSFATRRKKLDNLTAASLAPGDTVRVMGSPAPTSLGINGTWTNGPIGNAITPTSSTGATPVVMTKASHGLASGDTIIVNSHTVNTKANGVWDVTVAGNDFTLTDADGGNSIGNGAGGATGTFRKITSSVVKLASALTKNVACYGNRDKLVSWVPGANVTASLETTDYKEGGGCQKIGIGAAFTTGKAAYADISGSSISVTNTNRAGNVLGPGTLTMIQNASADDANILVTLPFTVNFNGVDYTNVYVGSNGYLTFGAGSSAFSSISSSNPPYPAIIINGADRSYQRVYAGSEDANATYRIRYEGSSTTSGTPGSSTVFWEITFTAASPKLFKMDMGSNAASGTGYSGVTDGSGTLLASFGSGTASTGYDLEFTVVAGSAKDFSGYKQLSFWIKQLNGTAVASGDCTLSLCSDTAGATAVNTINIPALGNVGVWVPVTVDTGAALGASIQSVAFNVVTDKGAMDFLIDNIIACKDSTLGDSISLTSLIGKNDATGDFWPIQSINGTRVVLDGTREAKPTDQPPNGYYGTTATVTTYKRETTKIAPLVNNSDNAQTVNDSGTSGSTIAISGGWNRTDMSTQTLESYWDGQNGIGNAVTNANQYVDFSKINCVRYYRGFNFSGGNNTVDATNQIALVTAFSTSGSYNNYTCKNTVNCGYAASLSGNLNTVNLTSAHTYCFASGYSGVFINGAGNTINISGELSGNYQTTSSCYGIDFSSSIRNKVFASSIKGFHYGVHFNSGRDNAVYDTTIADSVGASSSVAGTSGEKNYLIRCPLNDTVEVAPPSASNFPSVVYAHGKDSNADSHLIEAGIYTIQSQTAVRHTAADIAWQISPKNTTYVYSALPAILPLASIAVAAGTLVTASVWMQRDNTGLTARLMCKGKQILGVATDVSTAMTAAANTWEQVTITFTPSEAGVVDLTVECWGGTTYNLYVDDFDASQA